MKNLRSGFSNILILVFLVGLAVVMIAFLSSQGTSSTSPGTSPVPTVAGVQISPLSTPVASSIPLARIGAPILLQPSGPFGASIQPSNELIKAVGEKGMVLFDPASGVTRTLAATDLARAHAASHWLVYQDQPSSSTPDTDYSRIKITDLDTGKEILLGDQHANQQNPRISGNIVVWDEARNGQRSSIYGYDLAAKKTFPVVVRNGVRGYPRISGQWIAYIQWPGQNPTGWESPVELHIHSLTTGEDSIVGPMPMTKDAAALTRYAIDGDKIAWVKYVADGQEELHLYDLTTQTDRKLLDGDASDLSISAKNGIIVFPGGNQGWVALDWFQPTPAIISVTPPVKLPWGYVLSVAGNYLIWQVALDHDQTNAQIFVAPIVR